MEERQQFEVWKEELTPLLESKVEEFNLLGYDRVTEEDIWNCTVWHFKKEKGFIRFHVFVNRLLNLKPQAYMMWLTMEAYKKPEDFFKDKEI